jgi:type I restriction enzyme S subunit
MRQCKANCEELWEQFEPYADPQFCVEIKNNFDARYWEMYLATFLIREGYKVCAPKPGPDLGVRYNGCRIWIEATCPEPGSSTNPDKVPEIKATTIDEKPVFRDVPTDRMLLRYLNSISEKRKQWISWLAAGVVKPQDTFLIAINPRRLRAHDSDPPRILQVAYPIGMPYAALTPDGKAVAEVGYQFRDKINRNPAAHGGPRDAITSGVFLLDDYSCVSGLLCSRVDVANQPDKMGSDFQLVENRKASAPMPDMFRLKGTFFMVDYVGNGLTITPDTLDRHPRATIN